MARAGPPPAGAARRRPGAPSRRPAARRAPDHHWRRLASPHGTVAPEMGWQRAASKQAHCRQRRLSQHVSRRLWRAVERAATVDSPGAPDVHTPRRPPPEQRVPRHNLSRTWHRAFHSDESESEGELALRASSALELPVPQPRPDRHPSPRAIPLRVASPPPPRRCARRPSAPAPASRARWRTPGRARPPSRPFQ